MFVKNKGDFQLKFAENGCLTAKMIENVSSDYAAMYNRLDAGKSSNEHMHEDCDELYYVIDGCGLLKVGKETKKIKTGDLIVIPKGEFHFLTNEGDTSVEFLTIGFTGDLYSGWKWFNGNK